MSSYFYGPLVEGNFVFVVWVVGKGRRGEGGGDQDSEGVFF